MDLLKLDFDFQSGCDVSSLSNEIYTKRHSSEKKIVMVIVVVGICLVVFSYIPSAICWLSSIVFGVPSSRYWAMPLGFDET